MTTIFENCPLALHLYDCMVFNTVFNSTGVISQLPVHLSMPSCSQVRNDLLWDTVVLIGEYNKSTVM